MYADRCVICERTATNNYHLNLFACTMCARIEEQLQNAQDHATESQFCVVIERLQMTTKSNERGKVENLKNAHFTIQLLARRSMQRIVVIILGESPSMCRPIQTTNQSHFELSSAEVTYKKCTHVHTSRK